MKIDREQASTLDNPPIGPSRAQVLDLINRRTGAEQSELAAPVPQRSGAVDAPAALRQSSGMGLMSKIGGIEQALMVMGQDKPYRWLTLILFTGGKAQELDQAVLENALVRGRVAEQLRRRPVFAARRGDRHADGADAEADQPARRNHEAIVAQSGPYAPCLALAIAASMDALLWAQQLSADV